MGVLFVVVTSVKILVVNSQLLLAVTLGTAVTAGLQQGGNLCSPSQTNEVVPTNEGLFWSPVLLGECWRSPLGIVSL